MSFSHTYTCLRCPFCGSSLTQEGGVILVAYDDAFGEAFHSTSLDEDGDLLDVFDCVVRGFHSDTLCGTCEESLGNYEELDND